MSKRPKPPKANPAHSGDGQLRIIGGQWRSRQFNFPMAAGLRPTPNRVRETLFNWLGPYLPGAVCLDLFAGTGALGFESLSRGAAAATLLDADSLVVQTLVQHRETLATDAATLIRADALDWLATTPPVPHDIVFVDPPFRQGLVTEITAQLLAGWLKPHALVYLEAEKIPILELEAGGWQLTRQGRTRHVEFALAEHAGH